MPAAPRRIQFYGSALYCLAALGICGLVMSGLVGCGETAGQASQPGRQSEPALVRQAVLPSNAPVGAGAATPAAAGGKSASVAVVQPLPQQTMPPIPQGARWTVFCYAVTGPSHVLDSQTVRDSLNRSSGRSDWYVIHGQQASNVYFGFYRSVEPSDKANAADVDRAHRDLQFVRERKSKDGNKPFERSLFVALDAPDPTAPPEWNLFNVDRDKNPIDPKRAFWSLQIMAFRGHQLRKEAAVQAVADLRAKGVEAYYYHGDAVSSVTVGKWAYDAVKEQNRTDDFKDTAGAAAGTPMVVTNEPVHESLKSKPIDGKASVSVSPKLEIQNAEMQRAMTQFPSHAVNYEIGIKRDDKGNEYQDPSFLVEIPRAKGNGRFENLATPAPVTAERTNGWGRPRGTSMINSGGGR